MIAASGDVLYVMTHMYKEIIHVTCAVPGVCAHAP